MKKRKSILFILVALLLTMTSPALALEGTNTKTEITGVPLIPDIIVVSVPGNANVVLNPLELPIEINGESTTDQIVMDTAAIHNQSRAPVKVDVTVTGEVNEGSDMILYAASTKKLATNKKYAFIYFEIQATDDPNNVTWDAEYNINKHLNVRTSAKSKKAIVTLEAGDDEAPATNKCYGAFRLTGDCVATPKSPWTDGDGITAVVAFTFTLMPQS